jgi:NAD(P)-dependent dehydrogenase (short-subunit alcohol dehydrogenase family)
VSPAGAAPLTNRIALVTGASRGIGAATALALARAGAHVVAVARTVGGLEELDDGIRAAGGTATLVPLDLVDTDGIIRLAGALNTRYQRLDILIGNAGLVGPSSPLDHVTPKDWDAVLAVNVTANWHLIRAMDALLRKSDAGRAVFLSSGAAHNMRAYRGPYSVSKAALEALVRTYAAETESTAVRVNLVNPGPTRTRMRAQVMPGEDPSTLPPPEQVAEKIVALCLPGFTATGRLYDYPQDKLLAFRKPE